MRGASAQNGLGSEEILNLPHFRGHDGGNRNQEPLAGRDVALSET